MKTLKDFLDVLAVSAPYTVGTEDGEGWIVYYDGENKVEYSNDFLNLLDRDILNIYCRQGRDCGVNCCALKEGLAIIVEGDENGSI